MRISLFDSLRRSGLSAGGVMAAVFALHAPTAFASASKVWNESEIIEALEIKPDARGTGKEFATSEGLICGVAAILKTSAQVRLYESAGDVVAANPSRTAGVKIVAPQARDCLESAERLLQTLN